MSHQENKSIIDALLACAIECEHCATSCLNESDVKMMSKCIQLDRDCADICFLTASFISRGSENLSQLLNACVEICEKCEEECSNHTHMEHCKKCAEACRRCAEACRQLA